MGRPTAFSQEVADDICEKLAEGRSLRSICLSGDMPGAATVFRWLADERFSAFREQYARAREAQADALFDEILDIADDGRNDWMERQGDDGTAGWKENGEAIRRSQLRVDARKWMAGKLRPKKYGDSTTIRHADVNGAAIEIDDVTRAARLASLAAQINRQQNEDADAAG